MQQAQLIVTSTLLMLLIIVPVIFLTLYFAFRYRQSNTEATYTPDWDHSTKLELVIWGAPLLIIIALGTITWISTHKLDPYRPLDRIDAQLLHLYALGRQAHERAWLLAHDTDELDAAVLARLEPLLQRRATGEPLAYITGHKEFFGLSLQVDARVLDPRPDTETLVDWALDLLPADRALRVLDLGTGSGAVALAIQHERPSCQVTAVDASADASEDNDGEDHLQHSIVARFLYRLVGLFWVASFGSRRCRLLFCSRRG